MAYLKSQGCSIWKLDDSSPQVYEEIGQVVSISGPDGSIPEIDVTHLGSTGAEYIGGLPDFGNVSMEVIWDPASATALHADLWTDFNNQTVGGYQIRLSDSPQSTLTFEAYPGGYPVNLATGDKVGATISLRVTGSVTLA